jgi:hypothetical protein
MILCLVGAAGRGHLFQDDDSGFAGAAARVLVELPVIVPLALPGPCTFLTRRCPREDLPDAAVV